VVLRHGETLTYDLAGEERAAPMSKVTGAILESLFTNAGSCERELGINAIPLC